MSPPYCCDAGHWGHGSDTVLLPVTIGEGAVVGTGAAATRDVPDYTVVAGNSARVGKKLR